MGSDIVMTKSRNRQFITLIACTFVMLSLVGCGDAKVNAFLNTNITTAMGSRVKANKDLANELHTSGLLSDSDLLTVDSNIDSQMAVYMSANLSTDSNLRNILLASVVDWGAPGWQDFSPITGDVDGIGYKSEDWDSSIVTRYIANNWSAATSGADVKVPLFNGKDTTITPISIIDSQTGELVNERFGYTVYVLKPFGSTGTTSTTSTVSPPKSLDEVLAMVSTATADKTKVDDSVLDQLFTKAVDSSGNDVTLLNLSDRNNQVVADSTGSPFVTDSAYRYNKTTGKLEQTTVGNKVTKQVGVYNEAIDPIEVNKVAEPGNDMLIWDKSNKIPLISVRFHEFNKSAVDNITKTLGLSPDQYLFTNYNGENRVYIMEYPVNYVTGIHNKSGDLTQYECAFAQSDMGINLRTGKLIKYGSAWGTPTDPGQYFEDSDPYLPVKGAPNAQSEGQSAFVIEGETPSDSLLKVGENQTPVKTGRIILRDYLEATYAPKVVDNENVVAFGRKLRMLEFSGSKTDVIAKYYDKAGLVLPNSASLMIDDFADFPSIITSDPTVEYVGRIGEAITPPTTPTTTATPTPLPNGVAGPPAPAPVTVNPAIQASLAKIETIKTSVVDSIAPTTEFPGLNMDQVDRGASTKPLFYAMMIRKNMFDSALFSSWINNTDATQNSLDWWIAWLANTNRNYSYKINKTTLETYLTGNYTFQLQQDGILILDLNTINKIQTEYTAQAKDDNMKWFRTTFVILGYIVLCYAFVILMAWSTDTTVDLGLDLLGKVSFGHWVAIKDDSEIPYTDLSDIKFVTFKSLLFKSLGIGTVGILLILVNVVDVVVYLIDMFGGIAQIIGKIITGI